MQFVGRYEFSFYFAKNFGIVSACDCAPFVASGYGQMQRNLLVIE